MVLNSINWKSIRRLAAALGFIFSLSFPAAGEDIFLTEIQPILKTYCFKCHGPERPKGGVNLSIYTNMASLYRNPKQWETISSQLRDRIMPPEDKPQPSAEEHEKMVAWIEEAFRNIAETYVPKDPGRGLLRRLSGNEYNHTIRDLFGITNRPADRFPVDAGGGGGFDNNADTLFVPPILMEKFLEAADEILEQTPLERLFFVKPGLLTSKTTAARRILEHYAYRGFRRPPQKEEIERLVAVYQRGTKSGESHEQSVKLALKTILVSPNFLFRIENVPASSEVSRINDFELASRLSYFLWASCPDDELLALAKSKGLSDPIILEKQIARMIANSKTMAFAESFAGQWLKVRDLKTTVQPDSKKFPEFTLSLRDDLYEETILFFASILQENRSLLTLLDADYTFLNEDLARHYGIEGVKGNELRKVSLTDRNRGGILSMGSVLSLTSYPRRTSPVLRGKWVLEEILGTPPPPPPPQVASLPEDDKLKDGLTLRQRLESHRKKPECASCHKKLDPPGFGLENFDPIGRWRTEISGKPVDATGVMSNGESFTGPIELKKLLLKRKDDVIRNLTEKMLAYALGRGLEFYDAPTVQKICKKLAEEDYRSSVLIREIVMSYPFQYRRTAAMEEKSNE